MEQFNRHKLELLDHKDSSLSLVELLLVNFNKYLVDGGVGKGDVGYDCESCGDNRGMGKHHFRDMHYFKREYQPKDDKKFFYLMGQCKTCKHEQIVCDEPNTIIYWEDMEKYD